MSVIHAPKQPEVSPRMWAFPVATGAALGILFLRLWYVQVVKGPELTQRALNSQESTIPKAAPRGLIYDRHGKLVAGVRPEVVVTAVPAEIRKHPETLDRLAALLGTPRKKLESKLRDAAWNPFMPAPIYSGVPPEVGVRLAERADELPGTSVELQSVRYYPDVTSFTHVLGYVSVPSKDDVERLGKSRKDALPYVGKQGVEKAYDERLIGHQGGEVYEVDARRKPVRLLGRDAPEPGDHLYLSLDASSQKLGASLLGKGGYAGSIVALDPRTGEVLCMVSSPNYDGSVFIGGLSEDEWKALNDEKRRPMMNRAIQTPLAPGSTFKIVTAIAAAQHGIWSENGTRYCGGGFRLGRKTFKCLGHHGAVSFGRAMEKSCNTYFCSLGYEMGRDKLVETSKQIGLAQRAGLEIGGESRGDLPDERWLKRARPKDEQKFYPGDAVNAAIGQGAVNATPLQMAMVAALVANDGTSYVPHMVRAIRRQEDGKVERVAPKVAHQVELPSEFWGSLRHALQRVIESGTAQSARIPSVAWGGKTGSAEQKGKRLTHSWFVGFAPIDDPKIAICVRVEAAGHGGDVAAPIAKQIVADYLARASRKNAASASASRALGASPSSR